MAIDRAALGELAGDVQRGDRPARGGHLRRRSATSSPSAAPSSSSRSCSTSSTCPAAAHQDRLLHRCPVLEDLRAAHPMIDMLLDWRLYTKLRSTYVEALPLLLDPRTGPAAHDLPAGGGLDRPALVDRPEPPEHPHPHRARPADPPRLRGRRTRTASCWPPTTARSSCASWPTCRATCTCARRSSAAPTSTARRPPGCSRRTAADVTPDERSMAKMVNFGLAYGMSDFGLATRANIPRDEAQEFINSLLRGLQRHHLLHDPHQGGRQRAGLRRDAARPPPLDPGAARRATRAARRRGADGHQHAHPGHGRRHHEDRHDPAPRRGCATGLLGADAALGA